MIVAQQTPESFDQATNDSSYGKVIPFDFDGAQVRAVEVDGEPYFVARDVAVLLGYERPADAVRAHCKGSVKRRLPTAGGEQDITLIPERDVYRLVMRSKLPGAERFEEWVVSDVLPSIRKTGSYAAPKRPMTAAEMFALNAQVLLTIERKQAEQDEAMRQQQHAITELGAQVKQIEQTAVMTERPSAAESITHIRPRIQKLYGLPVRVIDEVMRQSPYAPKPAGMVRNDNEDAMGSTFAVYWIKDVNACFKRFVSECTRVTATKVTHPFIADRFSLRP